MMKKSQSAPCLAQIPEQTEDSADFIDESANFYRIDSWQAADEIEIWSDDYSIKPFSEASSQKTSVQLHHPENNFSSENLAEQLNFTIQDLNRRCDELSSQLMVANKETTSLQTTASLGIQALRGKMCSLLQDTNFLKNECEMLTNKIRLVGEAKDFL